MLSQVTQHSYTAKGISRRASKQLVQMIIGIIGCFGIMLAQVQANSFHLKSEAMNGNGNLVSQTVSKASTKIDWLELLF